MSTERKSDDVALYSAATFEAAFTEWDRRYREEPERFEAEAARLLRGTPESYGEAAAPYFCQIISEMAGKTP